MKINSIQPFGINYSYQKKQANSNKTGQYINREPVYFSVPFCAKVPKKLNIKAETERLQRMINDLLKTEPREYTDTELEQEFKRQALRRLKLNEERNKKYMAEVDYLFSRMNVMNSTEIQKSIEICRTRIKEISRQRKKDLEFINKNQVVIKIPKAHDDVDYKLLNIFKSAVDDGNFNLAKICKKYYSKLTDVKTLDELKKKFPKIAVPQKPEDVIAKKIENTVTRDFYEKLNTIVLKENPDEIIDFLEKTVRKYTDEISKNYIIDKEILFNRIADTTMTRLFEHYSGLMNKGFSSIPQFRKNSTPPISYDDLRMLTVNYDDFILSVIKKHYLNNESLSDIVCEANGESFSVKSLSNSEYKFEKASEKIKRIIAQAERVRTAQRDYENLTPEEFRQRLDFYSNSELAENENILNRIISFDNSRFEPEDKKALGNMLREFDSVFDGEKSAQDAIHAIETADLKPIGTQKYNEMEHQRILEQHRLNQIKAKELHNLRTEFNDIVNILYQNDMPNTANIYLKYIPQTMDKAEVKTAKDLMDIVKPYINSEDELVLQKKNIKSTIKNFDTVKEYEKNDSNNPIYNQALNFAKLRDGKIDIDKAGKYILNAEIIDGYPESKLLFSEPEILTLIKEKSQDNLDYATKQLLKWSEYSSLINEGKTKLSDIINIFDQNNPIEKQMLRYIVENKYINNDTKIMTSLTNDGKRSIETVFSSNAKQQIFDKYKYPLCLDYMLSFEDAMKEFTSGLGSSGIKKIFANNDYSMEVKITGHPDRLFCGENNGVFDIFSDKGLH